MTKYTVLYFEQKFTNVYKCQTYAIDRKKKANQQNNNDMLTNISKSQVPDILTPNVNQLPILILTHNRVNALQSLLLSLRSLINDFHKNIDLSVQFPVVVSIDSTDRATIDISRRLADHVIIAPANKEIYGASNLNVRQRYRQIASHYKFAFNSIFNLNETNFNDIIVLEDDLELAPDFLVYFYKLRTLLHMDKSILTISAWNDNGLSELVSSTHSKQLLHRTDFFPGLGWILTKDLWDELSIKWPDIYWDDWLRNPTQMKSRACIRPEVSRVSMSRWAKRGASNGLYFDYIGRIVHSMCLATEWLQLNLRDLEILVKDKYDIIFDQKLSACRSKGNSEIYLNDDIKTNKFIWSPNEPCEIITCNTAAETVEILKSYNLMSDIFSSFYRTVYRGYVQVVKNDKRIFIKTAT
ncbi:hypothetical protein GJ496_001598 [Pomphorhynchus laevis]|nr:hypothetical protein GJ496_001598 [Pomphorhynchus laevis]